MKRENFVTLILCTVGGIPFALGMCMCLVPAWNAFRPGVVLGALGAAVLLAAAVVRRRMQGKPAVRLTARTAGTALLAAAGALALGVGMCCTMVWTQFFSLGVAVGLAGIAAMAAALPLYRRITRRDREKLAPQILQLTEELGAGPAGGRPAGENSSPG